MKIIDNDKRVLNTIRKIQKESGLEDGMEFKLSANDILARMMFTKRKTVTERYKPTRDAVNKSLNRLNRDGFITRKIEQTINPKVKVNPVVWQ